MKRILLATLLLAAAPALAQPMTPQQQGAVMLGQQIGLLTQENGELRAALAKAQADLATAQAKIKELEGQAKKQP